MEGGKCRNPTPKGRPIPIPIPILIPIHMHIEERFRFGRLTGLCLRVIRERLSRRDALTVSCVIAVAQAL